MSIIKERWLRDIESTEIDFTLYGWSGMRESYGSPESYDGPMFVCDAIEGNNGCTSERVSEVLSNFRDDDHLPSVRENGKRN